MVYTVTVALVLALFVTIARSQTIRIPFQASHVNVVKGAALQPSESPSKSESGETIRSAAQVPAALADAWSSTISIPESFVGHFNVTVEAQEGPLQGVVQLTMNGTELQTVDLYSNTSKKWRNYTTEGVFLSAGSHVISGVVINKNQIADDSAYGFHCREIMLSLTAAHVSRQLAEENSTDVSTNSSANSTGSDVKNHNFRQCRRVDTQLTQVRTINVGANPTASTKKTVSVPNVKSCEPYPLNEQRDEWTDSFEVFIGVDGFVGTNPNQIAVFRRDAATGWEQDLSITCTIIEPEAPTHYIGPKNEHYVCP